MLLELLSKLFRPRSEPESIQKSSELSESSASWQAPSLGSLSNQSWIKQAVKQLESDEGLVLHAYQDSLSFWTIGYGRLIDKRKGGGITKEEADYLLSNDVKKVLDELSWKLSWYDKLDDARKAVLLNMSFQLGIAGLMNFKNTLAKIESGDYENAAANMMKSKWAEQTPNRAKRMAEQMRTGQWQSG